MAAARAIPAHLSAYVQTSHVGRTCRALCCTGCLAKCCTEHLLQHLLRDTPPPGHTEHIMLQHYHTSAQPVSRSTVTCARTHNLCQHKHPIIGRHRDPRHFHSIDTSKHMRASKALTTGRLLLDPSNVRVVHGVERIACASINTTETPARPVQRSCIVYLPRGLSITPTKLHQAQSVPQPNCTSINSPFAQKSQHSHDPSTAKASE